MESVLTVIADPATRPLSDTDLGAAEQALREGGARTGAPDWLAPGTACDLPFAGLPVEAAEQTVRQALSGAPFDLAAQAAEGRRKALLVADMESTIIGQEMIDELAEAAGLRPRIEEITRRAMAGELDFEAALRTRVGLLAGLSEEVLDEAAGLITLNPGARTLVRTMRASGAYTALVSGGFTHFTARVRAACGFDEDRANRLLLDGGRLSGGVGEPVLGRGAKLEAMSELAAARGLALAAVCAVGDGANDADMLAAAGLGVAYRGKAPARAAARTCIDHADLTALLYFQGYCRAEFAD
jgi:phosphoserine phosphatase